MITGMMWGINSAIIYWVIKKNLKETMAINFLSISMFIELTLPIIFIGIFIMIATEGGGTSESTVVGLVALIIIAIMVPIAFFFYHSILWALEKRMNRYIVSIVVALIFSIIAVIFSYVPMPAPDFEYTDYHGYIFVLLFILSNLSLGLLLANIVIIKRIKSSPKALQSQTIQALRDKVLPPPPEP